MAGAKVVGGEEMERWWYSEETLPVLGWNTDSFSDMKKKKKDQRLRQNGLVLC